jgi:AraC-like DNA-binding protein
MPSATDARNTSVVCDVGAVVWDVARPPAPSRVPGVSMAGFRDIGTGPVDISAVAHPAVTLVFEVGDSSLVVEDMSGREERGSIAVGLTPGPLRVRGKRIEAVQVRLSPVVAHAMLGDSPATLSGNVVNADELLRGDAERIRDQLDGAPSWHARFAIVDAMLARRYEKGASVDAEVAWAWHRIVTSRGQVRVDDLAAELQWSRKRLWSRFRSQIGLTPKRAAMLVRFDYAVHRLAAGHDPASVAADAGYVDQSHLHRDVATFTTGTPTTVAREPFLAVDDIAWPG